MLRGQVVLVGVLSTILGICEAATACPFCPPSSPPLAEQLAESDAAVLATWVRIIPAKSETEFPETVFRVKEVERDKTGKLKPGAEITVNFERQGNPGDTFFLMGKVDQEFTQWGQPLEVTEVSYGYIRALPSPEQPAINRLRHFLKFFEVHDRLIANDAFSEFSRAKYEDVVAIQKNLPRDKLRHWLRDPETDPVRLGFYAMLIGLCGDQSDAEYLWSRFAKPPGKDELRISVDGMMGGYLLLTGVAGFARLIQTKLLPADVADSDVMAVVNALRFLWEYAPQSVPREHVAVAMQVVLQRPAFAELALVDLARWKAWDATEAVLAWMGRAPFDVPASQAKLVQFARACLKDDSAEADADAKAKCQVFLDHLQREQPETWQAIERVLNPRVRKPNTNVFDNPPAKVP
ncbi:MAG TPA: hypothetical protein VFG20_08995 [Planctomycetaceae bacterium]|nr:hypothetical protein [Planctomycetaceae bacterium]